MARIESDREDLMSEAVALLPRAEFQLAGYEAPVVAGFRQDGCLSIYLGNGRLYQFSADGGLRRAFENGCLFRSQGSTLAKLTRRRTKTETQLLRHDLSAAEFNTFAKSMLEQLSRLKMAIEEQGTAVQQVPPDVPILRLLSERLTVILARGPQLSDPLKRSR